MKSLFERLLTVVVVVLTVSGCNDDVFVDRVDGPSTGELSYVPGGETTVSFDTKNLSSIYVTVPECEFPEPDFSPGDDYYPGFEPDRLQQDHPIYLRQDFLYRSEIVLEDGKVDATNDNDYYRCLWQASDPRPGRRTLRLGNTLVGFVLDYDGERTLTVSSAMNLTLKPAQFMIELDYGYTEQRIPVTIPSMLGGDNRYVAIGLDYEKDGRVREYEKDDSIHFSAFNPGAETMLYQVPVGENSPMYVDFKINPRLPIGPIGIEPGLEVDILTYRSVDGPHVMEGLFHGEKVGFSFDRVEMPALDSALGDVLVSYGWSFSHVYNFRISPGVGVKGHLEVGRLIFSTLASLRLRNEANGQEVSIPVKVDVSQPWRYNIFYERVENEEDI